MLEHDVTILTARELERARRELRAILALARPDSPAWIYHPRISGQHSARRGQDWRVRYRIDEESHTVVVLDVSHRSDTKGS
jgi:mRNA-degrading endonuclease RelE of RelBE toxin-antitoxin system